LRQKKREILVLDSWKTSPSTVFGSGRVQKKTGTETFSKTFPVGGRGGGKEITPLLDNEG